MGLKVLRYEMLGDFPMWESRNLLPKNLSVRVERRLCFGALHLFGRMREPSTKRGEEAFIAKERKDSSFRVMGRD